MLQSLTSLNGFYEKFSQTFSAFYSKNLANIGLPSYTFTSSTFPPTVSYDNGFCIAGEKSFNVYKITTDAKIKCNEARNSTADDK